MQPDPLLYAAELRNPAERRYTIMMIVLGLFLLFGMVGDIFMAQIPDPTGSRHRTLYIAVPVDGLLIILIAGTLVLRAKSRSDACLMWTKAVNIFLLFFVPFGTIIGIYGLRKLDKAPPQLPAGSYDKSDMVGNFPQ